MANKNILFGFVKYPNNRETPVPTAYDWLSSKQYDDDIGCLELYRIHNKLYDFKNFIHPGGISFLDICKGTDVTELFESNHVNIEKARLVLQKYYVRDDEKPRNTSTFTFEPDGFYCTIRDRAWEILRKNSAKPTIEILLTHDSLLVLFISLMFIANCLPQLDRFWAFFIFISGLNLALLANCAHNFFHQKNNWRMYSFDLTTHSSHEWRITHCYSHHMFPNTINDYEVTAFEPFVQFLPRSSKGMFTQLFTAICMVMIFSLVMIMVLFKRTVFILTGRRRLRWENTLPLCMTMLLIVLRVAMVHISHQADYIEREYASQSLQIVLCRVAAMYCACSFCFLHISLAAGHHHPDIWHAGDIVNHEDNPLREDELRGSRNGNGPSFDKPRMGRVSTQNGCSVPMTIDWGVFQLITVGRRPAIDSSVPLAAVSFGLHQLHHLFPTVDHSRLPLLQEMFRETCKEFKLEIFADSESSSGGNWGDLRTFTIFEGWWGMVRQAMRSHQSEMNFPSYAKNVNAK